MIIRFDEDAHDSVMGVLGTFFKEYVVSVVTKGHTHGPAKIKGIDWENFAIMIEVLAPGTLKSRGVTRRILYQDLEEVIIH